MEYFISVVLCVCLEVAREMIAEHGPALCEWAIEKFFEFFGG